jgi:hypothetical protein
MDSHYINDPSKTKEELVTAREAWLAQYQKISFPDKWKTNAKIPTTQEKTGLESLTGSRLPILPPIIPPFVSRNQQRQYAAPPNLNNAANPEPNTQLPVITAPAQNDPGMDVDVVDNSEPMQLRPQARIDYSARNFNPPWSFNSRIVDPQQPDLSSPIAVRRSREETNNIANQNAYMYEANKQQIEANINGILGELDGITGDYQEAVNIHTLASKSLPFKQELENFKTKHGTSDTQSMINNNEMAYQNKIANFDPFVSSDKSAEMNLQHIQELINNNKPKSFYVEAKIASAVISAFTSIAQKSFDAITSPYALMAASQLAPYPINAGIQYFGNYSRTSLVLNLNKLLAFGFELMRDIKNDSNIAENEKKLTKVTEFIGNMLDTSDYDDIIEKAEDLSQAQVTMAQPNSDTAMKIDEEKRPDKLRSATSIQAMKSANYIRGVAKTYGIEDQIEGYINEIDSAYNIPLSNAMGTSNELNKKFDEYQYVRSMALYSMGIVSFEIIKRMKLQVGGDKVVETIGEDNVQQHIILALGSLVGFFIRHKEALTASTAQAWGLLTSFVYSNFRINLTQQGEVEMPQQATLRRNITEVRGKGISVASEMKKILMDYKQLLQDNIPSQKTNTIITKILDLFDTLPDYKVGGLMKKPTNGCGMCGGKQNLMVHAQDPKDLTCKDCLNTHSMTGGRFTKREVEIIPEEDSMNEEHVSNNKQNKINQYLDDLESSTPSTTMEEFDNSAPIDKRFLTRMSQDFIINRPYDSPRYDTKDLDRLTYLIGLSEHSPETMTTSQRVNMEALAIKHLEKNGDPKASFPDFNKFDTFPNIQNQLKTNPGFLKRLVQ